MSSSAVLYLRSSAIVATPFAIALIMTGAAHAQSGSPGIDLGPVRVMGDEPSYLDVGAGAFNIQGHRETSTDAEGRIELRYGRKLFYVGPTIGLLANTKGGAFGYAGLYADIAFGHLVLTPMGAVGGYHRGGSEDLGGTFQFRLSAALAYQFENRTRSGCSSRISPTQALATATPATTNSLLPTLCRCLSERPASSHGRRPDRSTDCRRAVGQRDRSALRQDAFYREGLSW